MRDMMKVATTLRCIPRLGLPHTQLRTIDVEFDEHAADEQLRILLSGWFAQRGIADAVYDVDFDDEGPLAIINDDAYLHDWGVILN